MTRFTPSDYLARAEVEERVYGQTTLPQMLRQAAKDAAELERLRAAPTEYERKLAQLKEDFPHGI